MENDINSCCSVLSMVVGETYFRIYKSAVVGYSVCGADKYHFCIVANLS